VLSDADTHRAHVELLRVAAGPLTWGRTARELLALYREAVDSPQRDARIVLEEVIRLRMDLRELRERGTYDPEILGLISRDGAIPEDLRRPLLAISNRRVLRSIFFGPLRALYRVGRFGRRSH
jgi:hypothetical protein